MTTQTSPALAINPETTPAPTPPLSERGVLLPCPRCGAEEASISLNLDCPSEVTCRECEATFDVEDVRSIITAWAPVLRWLDAFPLAE